jgi:hypothetical protein
MWKPIIFNYNQFLKQSYFEGTAMAADIAVSIT